MAKNDRDKLVDYRKVCTTAVMIVLLPIMIVTFPLWGIAYYRSVIN